MECNILVKHPGAVITEDTEERWCGGLCGICGGGCEEDHEHILGPHAVAQHLEVFLRGGVMEALGNHRGLADVG